MCILRSLWPVYVANSVQQWFTTIKTKKSHCIYRLTTFDSTALANKIRSSSLYESCLKQTKTTILLHLRDYVIMRFIHHNLSTNKNNFQSFCCSERTYNEETAKFSKLKSTKIGMIYFTTNII